MVTTEIPTRAHDRHARRRPFATWMKRLANLKSLHTDSNHTTSQRLGNQSSMKDKKSVNKKGFYPVMNGDQSFGPNSFNTPLSSQRSRHSSMSRSKHSISISHDSQVLPKSRAATLATTAGTTDSGTGTVATTAARTDGDRDSTFSSPAPSLRSMTTTLTTIQSTAPGTNTGTQSTALTPTTAMYPHQPATAIPAHLVPTNQPVTYHSATANNVLSDNASMLTLASSSKRRRRNSVDTNASVRALAPASMFGGSRESLPLSVLSGTIINPGGFADSSSIRDTGSLYYPRATSIMNAERASLISASGITAPALASERNSYISTTKYGDGASVRSGLLGHGYHGDRDRDVSSIKAERVPMHGRNDSLGAGSIGANSLIRERAAERDMVTAPTSPMPT